MERYLIITNWKYFIVGDKELFGHLKMVRYCQVVHYLAVPYHQVWLYQEIRPIFLKVQIGNGSLKKESNLKLNLMSREYEKVSWDAPFDSSLSQSNVLTFPTICLWWAAQALACLLGHPQKNDDDTRCTVKHFFDIFKCDELALALLRI